MNESPSGAENGLVPLSPPPPAVQDDETAQLVEDSLARRQPRGWRKHSLALSPLSPTSRKRRNEGEPVLVPETAGEQPSDAGSSRPYPSRTLTGGSVKLDRLIQEECHLGEQKVLYRYVDVYENQRGWERLGSQSFSSRALNLFFHYDDPAPFTKYEQGKNGLEQVNLPYNSLDDVQLPSADWAWHSPEWLIDMAGDGMTAYDGFQYNTHFRMKGWGPVAPRWYSYFLTCVRRRKWLRLMVYLPSLVTSDSKGVFHPPSHIPSASEPTSPFPTGSSSADLTTGKLASSSPMSSKNYKGPEFDVLEIWRGNEHDWSRCHTALKTLHSDGRRLELWKSWIGDQGDQEEDILAMVRLSNERKGVCWTEDQNMTVKSEQVPISQIIADEPLNVDSSRAPRAFLAKVLSEHAQEILALFVYPDSRAKFHDMLRRSNLLEVVPPSVSFSISTDFRERLEL